MGTIGVPAVGGLPRSADVVIIGGGIAGCAAAFFASEAGFDSVVLEKGQGLGTLTTAASLECVRAQFDEPENVAMMMESIAVFEGFADVIRIPGYDINLCQQGYLFLTGEADGAESLRRRADRQHEMGLEDVEYLDGDEVRKRFPLVGSDAIGATYRARDGWLSAHELAQGFAKGSAARFALQTAATGIELDARGVAGVQTNRGKIDTRCLIIAAGPFSGVVAGHAGVSLPLTLLRRQKAVLGSVPAVPHNAPMTIDADTGAHWRPEVEGAIFGWALPETAGEPMDKVAADWTFPAVVLDGAARLVPMWNQVAEALTRENVFLSAGQYTCTPDHKPIIGPCDQVPGLFLSAGYSGHGIMASPGAARLLVDLIIDAAANAENPFRLQRFEEQGASLHKEDLVI
jgi:sarcosine oxidase subunit beta